MVIKANTNLNKRNTSKSIDDLLEFDFLVFENMRRTSGYRRNKSKFFKQELKIEKPNTQRLMKIYFPFFTFSTKDNEYIISESVIVHHNKRYIDLKGTLRVKISSAYFLDVNLIKTIPLENEYGHLRRVDGQKEFKSELEKIDSFKKEISYMESQLISKTYKKDYFKTGPIKISTDKIYSFQIELEKRVDILCETIRYPVDENSNIFETKSLLVGNFYNRSKNRIKKIEFEMNIDCNYDDEAVNLNKHERTQLFKKYYSEKNIKKVVFEELRKQNFN